MSVNMERFEELLKLPGWIEEAEAKGITEADYRKMLTELDAQYPDGINFAQVTREAMVATTRLMWISNITDHAGRMRLRTIIGAALEVIGEAVVVNLKASIHGAFQDGDDPIAVIGRILDQAAKAAFDG